MKTKLVEIENYLEVNCSDSLNLQDCMKLVEDIRKYNSVHPEINKILIDLYKTVGNLSIIERHTLGKMIAEGNKLLKTAVYYRKEEINKLLENTVVNRGGSIFVSDSRDLALKWLLNNE